MFGLLISFFIPLTINRQTGLLQASAIVCISQERIMVKIVLISDDCRSKAAYLETCRLPDFYMEDFSIQGLVVQQYGDARDLLLRAGYTILDKRVSSDIIIDHAKELEPIRSLLENNGIQVELSDIADTMYQA
jgi:hypothetical protein